MTSRRATVALTVLLALCSAAAPAAAQVAFTPCDISVGGGPVALTTDDFNSDGNPDLAVVDQQRNQVIVLLTNPQAFQMLNCNNAGARADVAVGTSPVAIAAGDLDRNLTVDLAVATQSGISILRGNASGVFMVDPPIPAGADPRAVAIADVNGDARADIIVGNGSGNSVTILFGAAQNEFNLDQAVILPAGAPVTFLVAEDLNLDGAPDIAAGSTLSGQVRVFLHDTTSATMFRALSAVTVGTAPTAMAVADFTRDAVPDIAVVGGGIDGALSVFRSNLPDSENPAFSLSDEEDQIGMRPSSVAAGNVDSDFDPDLVVTNQDDDTAPFFFGNGNGTVDMGAVSCATEDGMCVTAPAPRAVVLADVDADGRLDVITANQGDGVVTGSLTFLLSSRPATPTASPTLPPANTATITPTLTPTASPTITETPADTPTPTIPTPVLSNCFIPRPEAGCDPGECSACVCTGEGGDAFCCDEQWDLTCVQNAEGRCAPSCPRADTPAATLTPTITETPTRTLSPSRTPTETPTPTGSRSRTPSPTPTPTGPTPTESQTPTNTPTETPTQTRRPTSTPECVGEGMSQICTSGDTCAIAPNQPGSTRGLLVLLPGILGLALRRLRPRI